MLDLYRLLEFCMKRFKHGTFSQLLGKKSKVVMSLVTYFCRCSGIIITARLKKKVLWRVYRVAGGATTEACTVLYRTVPYRTVPYRTVLHRTVPYRTILYCTVPYRTVPYRTAPYRTVPCRTVPYRTAPYRTVPYRTVPNYTYTAHQLIIFFFSQNIVNVIRSRIAGVEG